MPAPLGRDGELAALRGLAERVATGHGGTVLLLGEAGIGKTRLLDETSALAAACGVAVLRGRAVPGGGTYRPFAEAVRLLDIPPADPGVGGPGVGGPGLRPYLPALGRLRPDWAPAQAPETLVDPTVVLGEGLLRLLRLLRPAGAVLLLDDLHWADPDSLELLGYLAGVLAGERVGIVAAARDEEPAPADLRHFAARRDITVCRLHRLGPADVITLARQRTGTPLAEPIRAALLAGADGLPLFVEELADALTARRPTPAGPTPTPAGPTPAAAAPTERAGEDGGSGLPPDPASVWAAGSPRATDSRSQLPGNDQGLGISPSPAPTSADGGSGWSAGGQPGAGDSRSRSAWGDSGSGLSASSTSAGGRPGVAGFYPQRAAGDSGPGIPPDLSSSGAAPDSRGERVGGDYGPELPPVPEASGVRPDRASAGEPPVLPPTLAALVAGRLGDLPDAQRRIVAAAAVLPGEPDAPLLAAVTGAEEADVVAALRAAHPGLLVAAGGRSRWRHALTREAVLATVIPAEQVGLARRGAALLLDRAAPGDDFRAAELLALAGDAVTLSGLLLRMAEREAGRGALLGAAALLDRAAATGSRRAEVAAAIVRVRTAAGRPGAALEGGLPELARVRGDGHADLCLALAGAAVAAGRWADADDLLTRAGRPGDARVLTLRAEAAYGAGDRAASGTLADRAVHAAATQAGGGWQAHPATAATPSRLDHAANGDDGVTTQARAEPGDGAGVAGGERAVGPAFDRRGVGGVGDAGRAAVGPADPVVRGVADAEVWCQALIVRGRSRVAGDPGAARLDFARAAQLAAERAGPRVHVAALIAIATVDLYDHADTPALDLAREVAVETGQLGQVAAVDLFRAEAALTVEGPHAAAGPASEVIELTSRLRLFHLQALAETVLAADRAVAADDAGMATLLDSAIARPAAAVEVAALANLVRALRALVDGDLPAAVAQLDLAAERLGAHGTAAPMPVWGLWAVLRTVQRDRDVAARETVRALPAGQRAVNRGGLFFADAIAAGRAGDRVTAAALLDEGDWRFAEHPWWGRLLRLFTMQAAADGGWADPVPRLRTDLAYFGSTPFARICRDLLRRSGAPTRRGRGDTPVPDALRAVGVTSREMDVLYLLAQGLTNAEIAERLFLSPRTVDSHVAGLLAKTGAAGRAELRRFLTR